MDQSFELAQPFQLVDVFQPNGNYVSIDCDTNYVSDHDNTVKRGTKYEPVVKHYQNTKNDDPIDLFNQQPMKYAKVVASWDNK